MVLIVQELIGGLSQQITVGPRPIQLYAMRPHLYRQGAPTGSLTLQVQDLSGALIAASETLPISEIGTGNFWHGDQRFLISAELEAETAYQIALVPSGGYFFSEPAYVGWCTDWDLRKVPASYSPNTGLQAALLLELWEMREALGGLG